jgi:hypothetical protein
MHALGGPRNSKARGAILIPYSKSQGGHLFVVIGKFLSILCII